MVQQLKLRGYIICQDHTTRKWWDRDSSPGVWSWGEELDKMQNTYLSLKFHLYIFFTIFHRATQHNGF